MNTAGNSGRGWDNITRRKQYKIKGVYNRFFVVGDNITRRKQHKILGYEHNLL